MIRTGRAFCAVRNFATRFMSLDRVLRPIFTLHRNPPLQTGTAPEH